MTPKVETEVRRSPAAWRSNQPFFLVFIFYALTVLVAAMHWHLALDPELYGMLFVLFGVAISVLVLVVMSVGVMLQKPKRLLPALVDSFFANDFPNRLVIGLPVALALPIFFSLFTSVKNGLSKMVPFYADPALITIDRKIHGGMDAWQTLHPLLGNGPAIFALNFVYNSWFIVMFVVLFCVAFSIGNERARAQYLVAFVIVWGLLGNFVATLFASVGPVYVSPFYGDETFSPLMNFLQATDMNYPVWALRTQKLLLANAASIGPRVGSGISAFPSIHVAVATLNAIYFWRFGGFLRWAGIAFLLLIQLGSVHLAWHYGIDGYASLLATPIIWVFAGWFCRAQLK
ncbi:phosphatase PAP2 family protein [Mesorhizobium hawassense]|nr:phosphatase PAP2 family protein [Mesorhizobium hawassense]